MIQAFDLALTSHAENVDKIKREKQNKTTKQNKKKEYRAMFTCSKKAFSPGLLIKITRDTSEEQTDNRSVFTWMDVRM